MAIKKVVPYGEWSSAISVQDATAGSKAISSPRGNIRTGRAFFLEATPDGASTIIEALLPPHSAPELKHVLPEPHQVATAVYEYGGGAYEVVPLKDFDEEEDEGEGPAESQRIIFSDAIDGNAVKVLEVDRREVTTLIGGKPWLRYADFGVTAASLSRDWVLAIEEDHTQPEPAKVRNYVVAVHLHTGQVTRLVQGADFYTTPRYSPDGKWIAWRSWNHPDMSWINSELWWAQITSDPGDDGLALKAPSLVAGSKPGEAVGEFAWGPDGALYFTQEVEGDDWRQMFRSRPGTDVEKLAFTGLEEVEIGNCSMGLDNRTFAFLSATTLILTYDKFATHSTVHIDLPTLRITPLDIPLIDMRDAITAITPTSLLMIGAGTKRPQGVYHIALSPTLAPTTTQLQTTATKTFPENLFATPEHIQLTSKRAPHRPIHGFYWPPHNPKFTAPSGTLPPLLVNPHGGPTSETGAGLSLGGVAGGNVPFYTSRGFAYFAINYTGSIGHGRAYRQRLDAQWGVLDRDDVPECIDYLCRTGRADRARVGIHGASAGGYNVLQSLVWHADVFAAGVCYCGVSDVQALATGTHKLESHYVEGLLYKTGMSEEERRQINSERSPLEHAGRITAPLLLLHGDQDTVVPIQQSFEIERKLRDKGGVVKMVVAPGDGHMFRKQASRMLALDNEVEWLMEYLVR